MRVIILVLVIFLSSNILGQEVFLASSEKAADLKVYVSTDTTLSDVDLLVYITEDSSQVVRDGIWYNSTNESTSAFTIAYVSDVADADIVISYVPSISDVRWLKRDKSTSHKYHNAIKSKRKRQSKQSGMVLFSQKPQKVHYSKQENETRKANRLERLRQSTESQGL